MIITVNEEWRITSTPTCWQVEKRKSNRKDGSERWEAQTYHGTYEAAAVSLGEDLIRAISDQATGEEIKVTLRQIREEVISASRVFKELAAES